MWQFYGALAEMRLQEMRAEAERRRSLPPRPPRPAVLRPWLGRILLRIGERLTRPVEFPAAH